MDPVLNPTFRIGDWSVLPSSSEIARGGERVRLEERTMRLLMCLAERPGEIVSIDDLLNHVWAGVAVSPDSVYQAVASLRRVLGDDPKNPAYIANVPRLGYRLLADVAREPDTLAGSTHETHAGHPPASRRKVAWIATALVVLGAAVGVYLILRSPAAHANHPATPPPAPPASVAVLPILDLTPGMQDEEFADGVTEELIDSLSRVPGFQVPPPTSSFAFKNKKASAAEAARALGVSYVLDGSVRKSGTWIRVDVRLIRASTGFIVWSETYDQPKSDILTIQDDIATKVTAALRSSIGTHGIQ